jgi:hypothetical protein
MLLFGSALGNHNAYLGYHGDFDAGAASCYKAAAAFGVLALVSAVSFAVSAVRAKLGHGASAPLDYSAV